jgi:hypothetical protein
MSDSLTWIDDADINKIDAHIKRIKGLLQSSADVVATARDELQECNALADRQPLSDLPKCGLHLQTATQRQVTPKQRRPLFQQPLRKPSLETTAISSQERKPKSFPHRTGIKDLKTDIASTSSSAMPKRRSSRLRERPANEPFQHSGAERARKRDREFDRLETPPDEKAPTPRRWPSDVPSVLLSWTHRLDYLTNAVIGVLATALVLSSFVHESQTDLYREERLLVGDAKASSSQQATHLSLRASLDRTKRSDIVSREFHAPASIFAGDISNLRLSAAALPAPPGMIILPYTGFPHALPAFPQDIAQLGAITSTPDPDGRDYLIRTLVFEASGETKIGKFAVAHAILNRRRSGRWGPKLADVVTSPWQFEPWMTRRDEIEALSQADPRYVEAAQIADAVLAGDIADPTEGATHFLNPVIVRERRGGSLPSWADSDGQPIGRHVFYCPECDGNKQKKVNVAESGKAKGSEPAPAASDRIKPSRVAQTVAAEAPADPGEAKAEPAVLRTAVETPTARSKPKPSAQRGQPDLPWNPTQVPQRKMIVEAAVKSGNATPAARDRVEPSRVGQTVAAEARTDPGEAKPAKAVVKTDVERPKARSQPKLGTQRQRTDLPWLNTTQVRQRRNFVPHAWLRLGRRR